jgi:histidinol-phosphate/aromatic aminotransferase/cobyric acid decarboxylase-like protein
MSYLRWLKQQYTDTWRVIAHESPRDTPFINFANSGVSGGDDALAAYSDYADLDSPKGVQWRSDVEMEWGHIALRARLAQLFGMPSPENVLPVAGASQALMLTIIGLSISAGCGIASKSTYVESPTYGPLFEIPRYLGLNLGIFYRQLDDGYRLPKNSSRLGEADLILLSNPHNPTGAHCHREEFAQFLSTVAPSAWVIVDETFLPPYAADQSVAHLQDNRVIIVGSLSKTLGLGSLRCGWILARGEALDRLRYAWIQGFNVGSRLTESIACKVLMDLASHQRRVEDRLAASLLIVAETLDGLQDQGLIAWRNPAFNFIAFPALLEASRSSSPREQVDAFCSDVLHQERLAIVPGNWFDPQAGAQSTPYDFDSKPGPAAHFRIGFGGTTAVTRDGMVRLKRAIEAFSRT